jgi:hypothetical protein
LSISAILYISDNSAAKATRFTIIPKVAFANDYWRGDAKFDYNFPIKRLKFGYQTLSLLILASRAEMELKVFMPRFIIRVTMRLTGLLCILFCTGKSRVSFHRRFCMPETFDVFVIAAGPGGYIAATRRSGMLRAVW